MDKRTLRDLDVSGKRVLLRVDFNVPKDSATGAITDDSRIRAAVPTIRYLLDHRARVIICSHMGRPKGPDPKESLAPVAERLQQIVNVPVRMAHDCVGTEVEQKARDLSTGSLLMLENLRFHPQEEKNDPTFARSLAALAEVYVNDAFGAAHRAHASTEGVAHHLPAVAGLLMEKELRFLGGSLTNPERPFAVIVGGAKISDKIAMMEFMVEKADALIVGGGMVATFLKAKGKQTGQSIVEPDKVDLALRLEQRASERGIDLLLPNDLVVAERFEANAPSRVVLTDRVPEGWVIMDIGPGTVADFTKEIKRSRTIIWNGPMGVFEMPRFSDGTRAIAECLANSRGTTVVGGGSTAQAVHDLGLEAKLTHVSTGGGASLEFLEGRVLPGVAALMDKQESRR